MPRTGNVVVLDTSDVVASSLATEIETRAVLKVALVNCLNYVKFAFCLFIDY